MSGTPYPTITCTHCGMTSHNPNDVIAGYCGNCHDWTRTNEVAVDPRLLSSMPELAPGVVGRSKEIDGVLWVTLIYAKTERNGDVGRFLDSLPRRVIVPDVINHVLAGMLARRGFKLTEEPGRRIPVWSRD